jgi:hypothetical protein
MDKIYLELRKSFKPWENIDRKSLIKELEKYYSTDNAFQYKKIIKIEIKNNKLYCDNSHLEGVYNNLFFLRSENILKLFRLALNKINKNNNKLRNFVCYFTINDYTISKKLPIFAFAKPINSVGILIPDWTFITLDNNVITSNWDDTKNAINNSKIKEKDNVIFFQGANTSKIIRSVREYKSDIRENIKLLSVNNDKFIVKIDEPPTPVTDWVKYKYLLDLPGAYPWSVRLKELLLMKSMVIKVDIDKPWVNFYSPLLKPNVDYIQIKYNNEDEPKKLANDVYRKILQNYKYMEQHPNKMKNVINSGYKNMNKLTMNGIIDYMVLVLKLTEELLHDDDINKSVTSKKTKKSKKSKKSKITKLTKKSRKYMKSMKSMKTIKKTKKQSKAL